MQFIPPGFFILGKQRLTFRKSSLQENRKCRYMLYVDLVVVVLALSIAAWCSTFTDRENVIEIKVVELEVI